MVVRSSGSSQAQRTVAGMVVGKVRGCGDGWWVVRAWIRSDRASAAVVRSKARAGCFHFMGLQLRRLVLLLVTV